MGKYMSDDEFIKASIINDREIYYIDETLKQKGITDLSRRIDYVKENYNGSIFLWFMLKELDDKILMNYQVIPEEYLLSKDAIDGILRAFLFASNYMQKGIPEHAYNYIKSKSSTFVYELEKQLNGTK
ncbi:hypothetical protein LI058_05215 [Clostridium perfringens]|uniref:hypothetical protein n=1 Tax=Clostridium perfringens TaxID=1502 RepID=UPI0010D200BD|nr:hypothetical protein [Clostridium perfringens]EHK2347763.1 hypothetical protein [Clostridium perfringens]MCX0358267.1 hypothetical protein [Clostridium perfringens]MCX0372878.1 hypothetical protein [Clostridium perfringens]MCX0406690.1 hypothetical protein [Clostridium perfringens]MCX0419969.1 hypothetical protein [Clostridium perfringens]